MVTYCEINIYNEKKMLTIYYREDGGKLDLNSTKMTFLTSEIKWQLI